MSNNTAILEIPNVVIVRGAPGVLWRDDVNNGIWLAGTSYYIRDGVFLDGSSYRAILDHVASANTKPGDGADWETVWRVVAAGHQTSVPRLAFTKPHHSQYVPLI